MEALMKINPDKEQEFRQFLALMQNLGVIESAQIRQNNPLDDTLSSQEDKEQGYFGEQNADKSALELVRQYRDLVD